MISYQGVIRKRLRLKGHPEIPPYNQSNNDDDDELAAGDGVQTPSSEQTALADENEITPVRNNNNNNNDNHTDNSPQHSSSPSLRDHQTRTTQEEEEDAQVDSRTEAERRHERVLLAREKERLRKEASKSYREKVDNFNKRLAEEPDHYDLFKTSFTK